MQAITVRDRDAGVGGLKLTDMPYPQAAENDVDRAGTCRGIHPGELTGRTPGPTAPAGTVPRACPATNCPVSSSSWATAPPDSASGSGCSGWPTGPATARWRSTPRWRLATSRRCRSDIDHTVAAALPISGLTAWQGLFDHGRLTAGQTVLIHGAAGGVGSVAVQLAREVGARVIGTGRTADRDRALGLGAHTFLDLETEKLEDAGEVDVVFDVIGGDILARSTALVRAGGTLVTIAEPPTEPARATGGALYIVVESDPARLADLAARLRDGRLKPVVGAVLPLAEAAAAFAPDKRTPGKTILRVAED